MAPSQFVIRAETFQLIGFIPIKSSIHFYEKYLSKLMCKMSHSQVIIPFVNADKSTAGSLTLNEGSN